MRRNNFFIFLLILLLVILAGHESFWTGIFSVLKFVVILISLILISTAIRFFIFYRKIKNEATSSYEEPRNGFPKGFRYVFYKRGFSTNPNSSARSSSNFYTQRPYTPVFEQSKTIEICPKCGYEKGENHICTKPN